MKDYSQFCFIFFAIFQLCSATYTDCHTDSSIGTLKNVEITGCDNASPKCILHRNSNVTFKLTFSPKKPIDTIKALVHGIVMDVPMPFPLPNSDGCLNCGLTCPLQADTTYTYETVMPVLKKYPKLSVDVKWQLQNEEEKDIVCLLIPSKIE